MTNSKKIIIAIVSILLIAVIVLVAVSLKKDGNFDNEQIKNIPSLYNKLGSVESVGMPTPEEALAYAAKAIKANNNADALKMFDEGSHSKISDLITRLDSSGKTDLAERIAKAKVAVEISDRRITYEMPSYQYARTEEGKIQVEETTVHFDMIKLSNGNWVIEDL